MTRVLVETCRVLFGVYNSILGALVECACWIAWVIFDALFPPHRSEYVIDKKLLKESFANFFDYRFSMLFVLGCLSESFTLGRWEDGLRLLGGTRGFRVETGKSVGSDVLGARTERQGEIETVKE